MVFNFKQFSVNQDQCAMKIGTDSVLLGSFTPIENNPKTVLDIGAGTGILSLMLAQRSAAEQIDAIEIEEQSYEQCVENFENSPWNDRLFCFHASLDQFMAEPQDDYDIIISNPPFYTENYTSPKKSRSTARFNESLPFEDLIEASSILLSPNGILSVIIPHKEEENFITLAHEMGLYSFEITRVKGTPTTEIKRSLIAFSRTEKNINFQELIIETARHQYTPEYIELTKDFYLKM
jgi:tRNA1Val (adenine37-N6)-methyltransferase